MSKDFLTISEECRGCRMCLRACPFKAIEFKNGKAIINHGKCRKCMKCIPYCPFNYIQ